MKKTIIISALILIVSKIIQAQPEYKFSRYTIDNGLSNNDVHCIFQDSYGFMWFGTKDGCCKFDGFTFKNYRHGNDNPHFSFGRVTSIIQEDENNLLIGILGYDCGLIRYNYEKDKFINLSKEFGLPHFGTYRLLKQSNGKIWIRTSKQKIFNFDSKTNTMSEFFFPKDIPEFGGNPWTKGMIEDRNGNIWFCSNGLISYNPDNGIFEYFSHNSNDTSSLVNNQITEIIEDSQGNLIITHLKNYISKYITSGTEKGQFKRCITIDNMYENSHILCVLEDLNKNLWLGTGNGIYVYNRENNKVLNVLSDNSDFESINDNNIRNIYLDVFGNLWVATRVGIAKLKNQKFNSYIHFNRKNNISNSKVECLFFDSNNKLWIGTPLRVDIYDNKQETYKTLLDLNTKGKKLSASPLTFEEEPGKGMWIGTWSGGLNYFDYSSKKNKPVLLNGENYYNIYSILFDSKKRLWVGTKGYGLFLRQNKTDSIINVTLVLNEDFEELRRINHIIEDSDNNIWIAGEKGLFLYDSDRVLRKIHFPDSIFNSELEENIIFLFESQNKIFWLGTQNGLIYFDQVKGQFVRYDTKDGLPSDKINSIQEDERGNLWIGTDHGLTKLTINQGAIISKVQNFYTKDGLPSIQMIEHSCTMLNRGYMAFGTAKGFFVFHPDSVKNNIVPPIIVFTDIKFQNRSIKIGEKINGQVILNKSISMTKKIILSHKNRDFSIQLVTLHYENPYDNKYAYFLEGYHSEWQYATANNRQINIMNLREGEYKLRVKSANSDGLWNTNEETLKLVVLPPWWRTWWFKILAIIVFVVIIITLNETRTYVLRKQKRQLRIKVQERTKEIMVQKEIVESQRDRIKDKNQQLEEQSIKIIDKNKQLESKNKEIQDQTKELDKMYKLLKKHNIELEQDVKDLSTAMVMQKMISYDEFTQIYPDEDACYSFIEQLKWGNGFTCKKCGNDSFYNKDGIFKRRCTKCNYVESLTAGTLFHKQRISIHKAFYILILTSTGREINISDLSNTLGLRVATCWDFHKKVETVIKKRKQLKKLKGGWKDLVII